MATATTAATPIPAQQISGRTADGGLLEQVLTMSQQAASAEIAKRYCDPRFTEFVHANERAFCRLVGGKCAEDGQIAALICASEGLTATQFVRKYHLIMGKPSMKAVAMLAEWRMRGGDHEVIEQTDKRAAIALIRHDGRRQEFELTWEQAADSRFPWIDWRDHDKGLKDNWSTPIDKRDMLWSRCISNAVATLAPEITSGVYTPEEMMDIEREQPAVVASKVVDAASIVAQAAQETPDVAADEVVTADGEITESCSKEQRDRIHQLYQECEITKEQQDAALNKRGVNSLISLSADQAAEIISKLEEFQKKIGRVSRQTG